VLSADDGAALLQGIRQHVKNTKRAPSDPELLHLALQLQSASATGQA
jgi:hypothetical protein